MIVRMAAPVEISCTSSKVNCFCDQIVAYAVGWVRTRAYFSEFGATWLTDQVSFATVASNSVYPLVFLAINALNLMYDLATGIRESSLRRASMVASTSGARR